jgi:hypothetical protein
MRHSGLIAKGLFAAWVWAAVVCGVGAGAAHAAEVIFSFTGGTGVFQGGIVAGNSFTAPNGATFNSLGFIDLGSDGIAANYNVGIFDTTSQTLLASATVTPASPLINGFRYAPIPATTIAPGQSFTIAASLPAGAPDPWMTNTTLNLGPGFTGAGTGRFLGVGTLSFPTQSDAAPYAVANASDTIVPEPSATPAVLLSLASLAVFLRRPPAARHATAH